MKRFFSLIALLITTLSFAQETATFFCYEVDEFTDKKTLRAGSDLFFTDGGDMKSEGIVMIVSVREGSKKKENKIKGFSIIAQVYGMKGCVDKGSTLDVIFEDGTKTQLVNWNDFSCEGTNYFDPSESQIQMFKKSPIKAMRYTNKRSYASITIKDNISVSNKTFLQGHLVEMDDINSGSKKVDVCTK